MGKCEGFPRLSTRGSSVCVEEGVVNFLSDQMRGTISKTVDSPGGHLCVCVWGGGF